MSKKRTYSDNDKNVTGRNDGARGRTASGRGGRYTDAGYRDGSAGNGQYDGRYPDDPYRDGRYAGSGYRDASYRDDRYTDGGYRNASYTENRYGDGRYPDGSRRGDPYAGSRYRDSSSRSSGYDEGRYDDGRYRNASSRGSRGADGGYREAPPRSGQYRRDPRDAGSSRMYAEDADAYSGSRDRDGRNRRRKKGRKGKIALIVIGIILLAAAAAAGIVYFWLGGKLENSIDGSFSKQPLELNAGVADDPYMKGIHCIALVGLDSRDGDLMGGNSDTMIVAAIDSKARQVKLLSIYRDTYLDIKVGEAVYDKANAAYARGGPTQMVTMLNRNLDLAISDYITVDFKALRTAIDDLGGIDVEMTEDEVIWMNDNGWETAEVCGTTWWYVEPGQGTYHLNGVQAVSYARIRKTTGNDFKRTSRQRLVLGKLMEKAKSAGITTLIDTLSDVAPMMKTSLSETGMISLAKALITYDVSEAAGFPFVHYDEDVGPLDCVIPVTLEYNVRLLHRWMFGDPGYSPSQTVRDISSYIADRTGFGEESIPGAEEYSNTMANPDSGSEADGK